MIVMLPVPPTANNLFLNIRHGRVKSGEYRAWIDEAGHVYKQQKLKGPPVEGPYKLEIHLPKKMRGDLDNRLKPIIDLLVTMGATPDDTHCQSILATRSEDGEHFARVVVEAA